MSPGYGHSSNGINLTNFRVVSNSTATGHPLYRTSGSWTAESAWHIDHGASQKKTLVAVRQASSSLQVAASDQVLKDVTSVAASLRSKIRVTEQLKAALTACAAAIQTEIEQCRSTHRSLVQRLGRVREKSRVNECRMQVRQVRADGPGGQDCIESCLLQQQGLVHAQEQQIRRWMGAVDRQVEQLEHCCGDLKADLKDKLDAIHVDSKALSLQPDVPPAPTPSSPAPAPAAREPAAAQRNPGAAAAAAASAWLPSRGPGSASSVWGAGGQLRLQCPTAAELSLRYSSSTPQGWLGQTRERLNAAHLRIEESVRLRRAIREGVHDSRRSEHASSRSFHDQLVGRMRRTQGAQAQLEGQVRQLLEERARLATQRAGLMQAIEDKRAPLEQVRQRLSARQALPNQEHVSDAAQALMRAEVEHLKAITSQLTQQLVAVERSLESLGMTIQSIETNISDKAATLSLDERLALMDGRITVMQPPPLSIGSRLTSHVEISAAQAEAVLRRITDLEEELITARREREQLEAHVKEMRASLTAQ